MSANFAAFEVPQDVLPALENAAELLRAIISEAAGSIRHTQKILHLVARGIEILDTLRQPFLQPPEDLYEIVEVMESLRKVELILGEARNVVRREAGLRSFQEARATWSERNDKLNELLAEAHAPELHPPQDWMIEVTNVSRLDDHLWVSLIAHDMRLSGCDLEATLKAEEIARQLLDSEAVGRSLGQSTRQSFVEDVMISWTRSLKHSGSPSCLFSGINSGSSGFPGPSSSQSAPEIPTAGTLPPVALQRSSHSETWTPPPFPTTFEAPQRSRVDEYLLSRDHFFQRSGVEPPTRRALLLLDHMDRDRVGESSSASLR